MRFISQIAIAGALATSISFSAAAQDVSLDTVVATVGDVEVTVGHVLDVKRQLPAQYQTIGDDVLFNGVLDQLIQQQMLSDALDTTPSWTALALENQNRSILAGVMMDEIRAGAVTDETLQAAYQVRYTGEGLGTEFRAQHILLDEEDQAIAIAEEARQGADFGELAKAHSTGPSGPRGGDLGWFGKGQMVPEFELAVTQLDAGGISDPVRTQFGWHVILLNDVREIQPPSLEDVRDELALELENAAVEAKVSELLSQTEVSRKDVDPSVMSTLSLTGE